MPPLVVTAPKPLSGKTTVAVGLARRLSREGHRVSLLRLTGDEHADQDASLFASLPFNADRRPQSLEPAAAAVP
jgi:Mrp family chromosome partitioning ATPase